MKIPSTLCKKAIRIDWLPKNLKAIAHKSLRKGGENIDLQFETDFFGMQYSGNLNNSIEYNIYRYGAFEKHLLFFLRDSLLKFSSEKPNTGIFYDVGANIGQHSLYISKFAKEVHSFEPYGAVSSKLEYHIKRNHIENITLHKVGLSDVSGELDFYAPTSHNQGIGSFDASTLEKGNAPAGKLELVNGDNYITTQKLPEISILKVDVEGFEKKALGGLSATLYKDRPLIVCEVSYGKPLSFTSLEEFKSVLPKDYKLYSFDNRKNDGSKAKKRGRKARYSGEYRLIPYGEWKSSGQDDIIACPEEQLSLLPNSSL